MAYIGTLSDASASVIDGTLRNVDLEYSDITLGGVTVALGATVATPAFSLSADTTIGGSLAITTSTAFGGDLSGTYDNISVLDNSHNHIISNISGLQDTLNGLQSATAIASTAATLQIASDGQDNGYNVPFLNTTGTTNGNYDVFQDDNSKFTFNPNSDTLKIGNLVVDNANDTNTDKGQIFLSGDTGNRIDFNQNGVAGPSTTTRSVGTKLVLYPAVSGTAVDYALGIESSTLWYSVPTPDTSNHRWYGGTTEMMTLRNSNLTVAGNIISNGSVGIGTDNPTSKLQVHGTLGLSASDDLESSFPGGRTKLTSGASGFIINHNDNSNTIFQNQGNERFLIADGGSVVVTSNGSDDNGANITLKHDNENTNDVVSSLIFANNGGEVARIVGRTTGGSANGEITFTTSSAATERMRITSGGFVGIGTDNPVTKLEIFNDDATSIQGESGTNNTNSILRLYNRNGTDGTGVDNYTGIRFDVASGATSSAYLNYVRTGDNQGAFLFKARNAASSYPELMRITSGGSVGIGTDNPTARLQVYRETEFADNPIIQARSNNGSTNELKFEIDGNGDAYFSGLMGIGTTSPNQLLEVSTAVTDGPVIRLNNANTSVNNNDEYGRIEWNTNDASAGGTGISNYIAAHAENAGVHAALTFGVRDDSGVSEAMRIDNAGRLLLGTNTARSSYFNGTAGAALQSEGTTIINSGISVTLNAAEDTSGSGLILARSRGSASGSHTLVGNNAPLGAIYFQGADGTDFVEGARIQAYVDGTPGADDMPTRLVFSTSSDGSASPTERMRIRSDGNLGIGTDNPIRKLDVQGSAVVNNNSPVALLVARERDQFTYASLGSVGDNEVKLQAGSAGTRNVDLSFYTSNGGSETEKVRITSDGNVGIGSAIPSTKLDVDGTIRSTLLSVIDNSGPAEVFLNNTSTITTDEELAKISFRGGSSNIPYARMISKYAGAGASLIYESYDPEGPENYEIMRIDGSVSSGVIGVGVTQPAAQIHASSNIRISSNGANPQNGGALGLAYTRGSSIEVVGTGAGTFLWEGYTNGTSTPTSSITSGGSAAFSGDVIVDGKVGIGTDTPAAGREFDVEGSAQISSSSLLALVVARDRALQNYVSLGSVNDNEVKLQAGSAGTRNVDLSFYTSNGGSETEKVRITSGGLVGIGTDNPTTKLEVNGTVTATSFSGPISGTAENATNITISATDGNNDNAAYPVLVPANSTGNQSPNIDTSGLVYDASATDPLLKVGIDTHGGIRIGSSPLDSYDATGNGSISALDSTRMTQGQFPATGGIENSVGTAGLRFADGDAIRESVSSTQFSGSFALYGRNSTNTYADNYIFASPEEGVVVGYSTANDSTLRGFRLYRTSVDGNGAPTAILVINSDDELQFNGGRAIFVGDVDAANFNSTSDIKLKENIEVITDSTSILKEVKGVKFDWKEKKTSSIGVIAQDVEKVLPQLISEGDDETKRVNYNGLVGVLIEAVKELTARVEELESKQQ